MKALQRRSNFGKPWPPTRRGSAGDKDVSASSWLNTFGPSPFRSLSYQFRSVPAPFALHNIPERRPLCFFIYLTIRLKSFISLLGNSSSQFFFLFFHLSKLPRLALNYSVSSPSCAGSLFDAAVLPPVSVASYAVINFLRPPGICFLSMLCFSTLPP